MPKRKSAVAIAVDILELLATTDVLGPRAIAARLEAPKSTVHRILEELGAIGVLTTDGEGLYRIGTRFHAIATASVANMDLVQAAQPVLKALMEETGETAILAVAKQDGAVIVTRVVSSNPIQYVVDLGRHVPLHSGAVGKAILAWLPSDQRAAYLAGPLQAFTNRTIVDPARLEAVLDVARTRGYVESWGELVRGAFGVAAPVWDRSGIVGAIGVTAPDARINPRSVEVLGRCVRAAAAKVSLALGASIDGGSRQMHSTNAPATAQ